MNYAVAKEFCARNIYYGTNLSSEVSRSLILDFQRLHVQLHWCAALGEMEYICQSNP
jgi:hypothetical protein